MTDVPPGDGPPDEGWTASDVGHTALDVAGLAPGYGEPADLANAAWYAAEGKHLEAGLSLMSMVPVVGDIIGKGGKLATKLGGPAARQLARVLKNVDFEKALGRFRSHPKLGPHMDKIIKALEDWRKEVMSKFPEVPCGGVKDCGAAPEVKAQKLPASSSTAGKSTRAVPPSDLNRSHSISGRASSRNVEDIAESMKKEGWTGPPIRAIEHKGKLIIIDGHHRLAAAKQVGLKNVPVEVVPFEPRPGSWQTLEELLYDAAAVGRDKLRKK